MTRILTGDVLDILKTLPDNSVDTCITSPPYYGLRDYGTGQWVGGDSNCNHHGSAFRTREKINEHCGTGVSRRRKECYQPFKTVCSKCGAVRVDQQIGLEETPQEYIDKLVAVFREVRRVLKDSGTLWINIADSYAGSGKGAWKNKNGQKESYVLDPNSKPVLMPKTFDGIKAKDLIGIPWELAFALRSDGWYLRQDIIWYKPNCMPESVTDRCTKSHEYIFLFSKSSQYYFDYKAIQEPAVGFDKSSPRGSKGTLTLNSGRRSGGAYTSGKAFDNSAESLRETHGNVPNETGLRRKRSVWSVSTVGSKEAHFATFPEKLIEPCILAGCPVGGIVLDPFLGSGTTAVVSERLGRNCWGIELNPEYVEMTKRKLKEKSNEQQRIYKIAE